MTLLLLLYRFIDSYFSLPQYAIRVIKTAMSLPLVIWTCFILGSRIVHISLHL